MIFIGLDPGSDGGIAIIDGDGKVLELDRLSGMTDAEIFRVLKTTGTLHGRSRAMLERVSASPQMGVTSAFTFGGEYRALRMALTAAEIPFDEVAPFKWQRGLGCVSGGDKRVTKNRASQLFPGVLVTNAIADALLIAEFCRRWEKGLKPLRDETVDTSELGF